MTLQSKNYSPLKSNTRLVYILLFFRCLCSSTNAATYYWVTHPLLSKECYIFTYIHIQKFWADVSLQICLNCAKWGERDKDGPQVVNNKTFRRQLFLPPISNVGPHWWFWFSSLKFLLSSWTAERFMYQDYYTILYSKE